MHHPDRVSENDKAIAKEKISMLHQAYVVLSDSHQRQLYDNGCDILFAKATRSEEWQQFLKPTTSSDVNNARSKYQNSLEEQRDIQREYLAGNGSMIHMLNNIPFMRVEDEARIVTIIKKMVAEGELPQKKIKKITKT